eukprot:Phypoly_transcript_00266.p1 GENE.Phypoly_transcript_00266~~Phypoly_transcript_00266.p1  ORF type:complete len:1130 (+),score=130.42 Phypoly_transcript_00266:2079-5468(+)
MHSVLDPTKSKIRDDKTLQQILDETRKFAVNAGAVLVSDYIYWLVASKVKGKAQQQELFSTLRTVLPETFLTSFDFYMKRHVHSEETCKIIASLYATKEIKLDDPKRRNGKIYARSQDKNRIINGKLKVIRFLRESPEIVVESAEALVSALTLVGKEIQVNLQHQIAVIYTVKNQELYQGLQEPYAFLAAQNIPGTKKDMLPVTFEDLVDLPCIVIVVDKGRMGDTFPDNFDCLDMRARIRKENSFPQLSTFVQELGRLCCYNDNPGDLPRYALVDKTLFGAIETAAVNSANIDPNDQKFRYCTNKILMHLNFKPDSKLARVDRTSIPAAQRMEFRQHYWPAKSGAKESYDCKNIALVQAGKTSHIHTKRLLLRAEPQVGKTGTYLYLLDLLRSAIGFPQVGALSEHFTEPNLWECPDLQQLRNQRFDRYSEVNKCKYDARVQWERVKVLLDTVRYKKKEWKEYLKSNLCTREVIVAKQGLQLLDEMIAKLAEEPPARYVEGNESCCKINNPQDLIRIITWDKRGHTSINILSFLPKGQILKVEEGIKKMWKDGNKQNVGQKNKIDESNEKFCCEIVKAPKERMGRCYNTKAWDQVGGEKSWVFTNRKNKKVQFRVYIPDAQASNFKFAGNEVVGANTEKGLIWIFTPTMGNIATKRIKYPEPAGVNAVQVLVVKKKEFESADWRREYVLLELPDVAVVKYLSHATEMLITSENNGCGFARLVIQVFSSLLGIDWSWHCDDNVLCVYKMNIAKCCQTKKPHAPDAHHLLSSMHEIEQMIRSKPEIPDNYALFGLEREKEHFRRIRIPFMATHRIYSLYIVNNRLTVQRGVFWPAKEVAEDMEFHHHCNDNGLLSVSCQKYLFDKFYTTPNSRISYTFPLYKWDMRNNYLADLDTNTIPDLEISRVKAWLKSVMPNSASVEDFTGLQHEPVLIVDLLRADVGKLSGQKPLVCGAAQYALRFKAKRTKIAICVHAAALKPAKTNTCLQMERALASECNDEISFTINSIHSSAYPDDNKIPWNSVNLMVIIMTFAPIVPRHSSTSTKSNVKVKSPGDPNDLEWTWYPVGYRACVYRMLAWHYVEVEKGSFTVVKFDSNGNIVARVQGTNPNKALIQLYPGSTWSRKWFFGLA